MNTDASFTGSIIGLRGWELVCLGLWLAGAYLVIRSGRTRFLAGIYVGSTLAALAWDWILGDAWFFRIEFDPRFIMLYNVADRVEPLWAPLSYGFFFGITSLVALRYRRQLDSALGQWQLLVIPVALGLSDILIEGITTEALGLYTFHLDASWTIFGVPYTNVLFVAVTEFIILYCARGVAELLENSGVPAIKNHNSEVPANKKDRAPSMSPIQQPEGGVATMTTVGHASRKNLKYTWSPFLIGLVIPSGAIYLGMLLPMLLLNLVQPW